jgi:hypothetical protein
MFFTSDSDNSYDSDRKNGFSSYVQSPKIIMTGLKLIPLTFSFEINPWVQLQDVLIYLGMLKT